MGLFPAEAIGPEDVASTLEAEGFFDRRARAVASRGSSRVLKAGQMILMKMRNCSPSKMVTLSNSSNVWSVCILSLANPCQWAHENKRSSTASL